MQEEKGKWKKEKGKATADLSGLPESVSSQPERERRSIRCA